MRRVFLALMLLAACAGTADDGPVENFAEIPEDPDPAEAIQFVMPEWTVPAGEEKQMCWVPEWSPPEDMWVTGFEFSQGLGGHHLTTLRSNVPVPAGEMWDCTQLEAMTNLEPLVVTDGSSDGGFSGGGLGLLEEGFAFRMEEATTIVIQSHYVNYSQDDWLVRDVGRITLWNQPEEPQEAGYIILNHGSIDLDPGEGDAGTDCTLPVGQDFNLIMLFGHMHELGREIRIEAGLPGTEEELYAIDDWEPDFRDLPPVTKWDSSDPVTLPGGSRFAVDCHFNNTRDHQVRFPEEMCVGVGIFYPVLDENVLICSD